MPKEYVNDAHQGSDQWPAPRVRLGWSKDAQHVQLATIAEDWQELEPTPEGNGWFVSLNRHGINQLIRMLRRARDQAYGADA